MALTPKQQRFVDEYLVDLNATQAAIRAGYSAKTSEQMGYQLLQKTSVQKAVQEAQAKLSAALNITQEGVLKRLWSIATANPNDLVRYRRVNCRYCWGEDHYYQWTNAEYYNAQAKAKDQSKPSPDCDGGFGFDKTRPTHPDCPECKGEGVGCVHVSDTSRVEGDAAVLYAGVKETRDGIQVLMHDQLGALEKIARHLGMYIDRQEITGKNGEPIKQTIYQLTPQTAEAIVKALKDDY
jgi:phage terminase small subunit